MHFNNWLNSKPCQNLQHPDFKTQKVNKCASFNAVKKLHELEYDLVLKHGYSLNLKALFPSSLERQNDKLSLKVFKNFVIEGLKKFSGKIHNAQDTADFIYIMTKWWSIVNVKTLLKGKRN